MQPNYISIATLFGVQTRYTVPLFQRPYVWSELDQWKPLWDDLHQLIQRVLHSDPAKPVAGHFLGTVVLEHTPTTIVNLPRREVIDGQQRLTTLQIVLKAAEHALLALADASSDSTDISTVKRTAETLAYLTKNGSPSAVEEAYKVWPTNADRAAFRAVMDSTWRLGVGGQETRMAEAYRYFREIFLNWVAGPNLAIRAQVLASALKDHVRLIVLDLEDTDEPQAIFETLNAHGTPLLPADLMKNWILWEATKQKLAVSALYEDYWKPFDHDAGYWREKTGVGHAARPRIDTFFQYWLTRHILSPVSAKHIYRDFIWYMKNRAPISAPDVQDIGSVLADIKDDAKRFQRIQSPTGATRFDEFLRRLERLNIVVFYPFLLALLALLGREASDQNDLDEIAVALESYLVRRMVCNLQTRGYGTFALELLDILSTVSAEEKAAPAIVAAFDQGHRSALQWPDDESFRAAWATRRFYGSLRKDRVLMMLQAVEEQLQRQSTKSEPVLRFDFGKLTIEHVLPQSWSAHWPLDEGTASHEREQALHSVGNLTLVSKALNPTLSNAPWLPSTASKNSKRAALEEHSNLLLNSRLVKGHPTRWDEAGIRRRSMELFDVAKKVWPGPPVLEKE